MNLLLTLAVLCIICLSSCTCLELPARISIGDNAIVLLVLATFGTISLIGACAFCFRKKKTFEKLENEAGSPENLKKNEYPIFRALATDVTESSAIVPCERNNLSRDNLLNSSDNLTTPDHHHHHHHNLSEGSNGSLRKLDAVDSSDVVVLLDKSMTQRDRSSRDTITFETEKKHQHSPSSKTPLLYAKNVQSYHEQPPINEQLQQKSVASNLLSHCDKTSFDGFYNIRGDDSEKLDEIDDFINSNNKNASNSSDNNGTVINPFFNSTNEDFQCVKEVSRDKDDTSEIESSINDNSEKYQILDEETDGEDIKIDDSPAIKLSERKNSDYSASEDKSVEEALKALDMAIGFEEYDDDELFEEKVDKLDEIKEEATFLVDSIVNDCEKILEEKQKEEPSDFDDFLSLTNQNMSTPCASNKATKLSSNIDTDIAKALFPGGIDISEVIDTTYNVNETYEINDKTYDAAPPPIIRIEKDKDEVSSEDLTTVTPVNTPIELSYSSETWDKMSYSNTSKGAISKIPQKPQTQHVESPKEEQPTFNQDGWYLHPLNSSMKNDTFDVGCDDEEEMIEEGNMEDMSSTFDQLRRQLTEMLPHAQGMSVHNDFLDDDLSQNKDSSSPSDNNYGIKYGDLDEATNAASFDLLGAILNPEPVTELNINYHNVKRPLSPILEEESECDETCRTFVLNNETKLLDSTSTGIMESASDAVMGQMPKALMASNDTLFNFEDTLSDQTDNLLMSPRITTAGSSTSSTLSRQDTHDKISLERTPTNEDLPKIGEFNAIDIVKHNIRQHPLSLDLNSMVVEATSSKYDIARAALEEGSWPLELPEAQQIVNDLSSPEQNPTADSLSFEQDITYTIDDQKTCVSLILKNDEERISEISEPLFVSESFDAFADDANSLQIDDAVSLEIDDNCNLEINDENGNQHGATKEIELHLNEASSLNYDNDSINPGSCGDNLSKCEYEIDSLEPETRLLNEGIDADSIPGSHGTKSIYSADSMNDVLKSDTVQSNDTSESNSIASPQKRQLDSSEESELSNDAQEKEKGSSPDIRQVSCNNAMMSTSFTKEWSDDDSSHSSEEFMYVKGTLDVEKITSPTDNEKSNEKQQKEDEGVSGEQKSSENMDIEDLAVENNASHPEVHSDDESAEESEFVPSCWDQSLQPSKSSLKSPEREGSIEQPPVKTRRRVAFKIQRYHSVYEYPSEVVQLSPAYSEPQLWSNYDYSGNIDFFTYTNPLADLADNFDGFSISSSSRPFHNNTHNIQIHNTWPNETTTDFSWSQYQDTDGIKFEDTPLSKIDWPAREDDSGYMCESTDSPSMTSMGELIPHKNSLRLPLELISSTCSEVSDFMSTTDVITKDLDAVKIEESPKPNNTIINVEDDDDILVDEEDEDKMNDSILPTPLSGSIDSLSSNSHSGSTNNSSPPSFTTFGKEVKENEVVGRKTQTIIFIEEDVTRIDSQKKVKNEAIEKGGKGGTLQSSDDDSGFENVVQIKCEE